MFNILHKIIMIFYNLIPHKARGSPHTHTILWVEDAPQIDINTDEDVTRFINAYQKCTISLGDNCLQSLCCVFKHILILPPAGDMASVGLVSPSPIVQQH